MAIRHQLIERTPEQVWAVLADPRRYHEWVVGVAGSASSKGEWPRLGADLVYQVALGPWKGHGRTVVRRSEAPHLLELEADSGPFGSARIALEVRPWGEQDSGVIIDEHPLRGAAGSLHNVVVDAFLQLRHRSMLKRLADVVEKRTPRDREPLHTVK
ncbi:Polyketide cyclase / dehydrase and lipid transport [Actinacidiphila yanglinensis]|uniref:Polyketide cyclase / dehydrase and lipid transport n=1 Tax=Actinacidiphila yanglinensis TaxID=310779 RepID=A0A1H6DFW0_9ACTN|nr:SRPBCC family protein [Actinacidiphila yanglinensis]SEG84081.1 Polyketide cyclase / dehydrase and lipid transport [Actinacidiphila yanglinensis]